MEKELSFKDDEMSKIRQAYAENQITLAKLRFDTTHLVDYVALLEEQKTTQNEGSGITLSETQNATHNEESGITPAETQNATHNEGSGIVLVQEQKAAQRETIVDIVGNSDLHLPSWSNPTTNPATNPDLHLRHALTWPRSPVLDTPDLHLMWNRIVELGENER